MTTCTMNNGCEQMRIQDMDHILLWKLFDSQRSERLFCDVIIKCEDGQLWAHRALLAANSPYFRSVFTDSPGPKQAANGITTLHLDMPCKDLGLILDYIYTRNPNITMENAFSVLQSSKELCLQGLVHHCILTLKEDMDSSNCVNLYNYSKENNLRELEFSCQKFIVRNFRNLLNNPDQLQNIPEDFFFELLDSDHLFVYSEEELFEASVRWIEFSEKTRAKHFQRILELLRFNFIQRDYFLEKICKSRFLNDFETSSVFQTLLRAAWDLNQFTTSKHRKSGMSSSANSIIENPSCRPRVPSATIFILGGWSGGNPVGNIETYDSRIDSWYTQKELKEPMPRAYHGLAELNNCVYVLGGFDGRAYYNSMRCFNPMKKTWSDVAPMYHRRCYVSTAVLDGLLYACGGFDGRSRLRSVERYNPDGNQWQLVANMLRKRSDSGATSLKGMLYVAGGFNGDQCMGTVEMYNPELDQWTAIHSMLSLRSGLCVVSYKGMMCALGGFDGEQRLASVEQYDPDTQQWVPTTGMRVRRSNFTVAVMEDKIFAIGGFNGNRTIHDVEFFDDTRWRDCTDINMNRSALKCCVLSNLSNMEDYTYHGCSKNKKKGKVDGRSVGDSWVDTTESCTFV